MAKFMASHSLPPGAINRDQVCQIADAAQHDSAVRGYRSFLNLSEGKCFCILEANDAEAVVAWFQKMGLPYDFVVPVELEGERGTIQDVAEPATATV